MTRPWPQIVLLLLLLAAGAAACGARAPMKPPARSARYVVVPGESLWVVTLGDAPGTPLFVANGGPGFAHDYELIGGAFETLARTRRVILWDQRGTGRSGPLLEGQSCTAWDQAEDLEALRAAMGFERFDLFGHSWGGLLAMMYAVRHGEHLAHLVICDSASPRFKDTPFRFGDFDPDGGPPAPGVAYGDTTHKRSEIEAYLAMIFVSPAKREAFIDTMRTLPPFAPDVNAAVSAELDTIDVGLRLERLTAPTLVLTGRWDTNVAPIAAWKIRQAIPGARWRVFEHSGHIPAYEEPQAFVTAMQEFLGQ